MTREQYERSKRQLEEQLRAGTALLEKAYHAQIAALDVVWRLHSQAGDAGAHQVEPGPTPAQPTAPSPALPAPVAQRPRRRSASEVQDDIATLFWRLPASFTRGEVCEVLGYEPDRTLLYRALRELVREGHLAVEEHGSGQRATLYRKTTPPDSPPST